MAEQEPSLAEMLLEYQGALKAVKKARTDLSEAAESLYTAAEETWAVADKTHASTDVLEETEYASHEHLLDLVHTYHDSINYAEHKKEPLVEAGFPELATALEDAIR